MIAENESIIHGATVMTGSWLFSHVKSILNAGLMNHDQKEANPVIRLVPNSKDHL